MKIPVTAIDLSYVDCVRHFYPGNDLSFGQGVTVGVIDSGVATNHPGLVVQGGQNTVPGEKPGDYGDNGTEGHGTHVAGIIAARGTPPKGIRGVAPGVTLRSYRVFPQGGNNASNYAIAKAIDAGVADQCDLLNMSLGGGSRGYADRGGTDGRARCRGRGVRCERQRRSAAGEFPGGIQHVPGGFGNGPQRDLPERDRALWQRRLPVREG